MNIIICILFLLIIAIQGWDFYSTKRVIDRGGYETNKVMAFLISKLGLVLALLSTKIALITLLLLFIFVMIKISLVAIIITEIGICLFYFKVVVWNNWKAYQSQKNSL